MAAGSRGASLPDPVLASAALAIRPPAETSVRRVLPGALRAPRGWAGCRPPPTARPDSPAGAATGQGRKRSVAPWPLTAGALLEAGGGGFLPSESRCPSQPSPGLASRSPLHTGTRAHTRRNTGPSHKRPAHRTGLQRPGPGGTAGTGPWGWEEGSTGLPQGPGEGRPRPQRACRSTPSRERAEGGPELDPGASGREREKPVPTETRGW